MSFEINIDGIVGPTHNYSGLSVGNIASQNNQLSASNPKKAALEGLEKMWYLVSLGIRQVVMPPQERPHISTLQNIGFTGTPEQIISKASKISPELLRLVSSASNMWCANAATFSPSQDCFDQKVHITPANLSNKFHRSIEAETTKELLKLLFPDPTFFTHHAPLPCGSIFSDEGAANHTRLCKRQSGVGINLFTFGRYSLKPNIYAPKVYPARQTFEASAAIARLHQLSPKRTLFLQQSPKAIDAGVFHNDVIAVGNRDVLFYHEDAYINNDIAIEEITNLVKEECDVDMCFIKVEEQKISIKEAVETYLFNSQLITLPTNQMALIAPIECERSPRVNAYLEEMSRDMNNPIAKIHFLDVRQSIQNGGGPACLRLRAVLKENEYEAMNPNFLLDEPLYGALKLWIQKHYRDQLHPKDLLDSKFIVEVYTALDELTKILNMGSFYSFQKK